MSVTLERFWPSYDCHEHLDNLSMKWPGWMQFWWILTYLAQVWGILRTVQKLYMFYMKVVHHKHIRMMVKPLMRFQLLMWHMIKRDSHLGAAVLLSLNGEVSVKTHFSCSIISSGIIDAGLTDCRVLYLLRVTSSVQLHHWWQPLCQPERKCKLEKEF